MKRSDEKIIKLKKMSVLREDHSFLEINPSVLYMVFIVEVPADTMCGVLTSLFQVGDNKN